MSGKPKSCIGCPLYTKGHGWVPSSGPEHAPITLVGEAPGSSEAHQGQPFVGDAGVYLNRALKRLGADRDQYRIMNCIQCQPPNNWLSGAPWEAVAIQYCKDNRTPEWRDSTTYVTMGKIATRTALLEMSATVLHGKIDGWHAYVIPTVNVSNSYIIPSYHPAYLLRGKQKLFGAFIWVQKRAMEVASFGYTPDPPGLYCDPDPLMFEHYVDSIPDDPAYWLSVDIETTTKPIFEGENEIPSGTPTRISFCHNPAQGITVPWEERYLFNIRRAMQTKTAKVFWNANFDVPIMAKYGQPAAGDIIDGMWAWHMLQSDLPKSLGFVTPFYSSVQPWKHTALDDMPKYAANDPVQALRCMFGIAKHLKESDQWDTFWRFSVKLDPLLRRMRDHGIEVHKDGAKSLDTYLTGATAAYFELMKQDFPDHLLPEDGGLKRPREGYYLKQQALCCNSCGAIDVTPKHKC